MLEIYPVGSFILLRKVMKEGSRILVADDPKGQDSRVEFHVVRTGPDVKQIKVGDILAGLMLMNVKFRGEDFWLADEKNLVSFVRDSKTKDHIEGVTVNQVFESL